MGAAVWVSVLIVAALSFTIKAVGPAALGHRELPAPMARVITLLAPALLAAFVVVNLAGEHWGEVQWPVVAGVGVAGAARLLRAPMLVAMACGVVAAALLRLLPGV